MHRMKYSTPAEMCNTIINIKWNVIALAFSIAILWEKFNTSKRYHTEAFPTRNLDVAILPHRHNQGQYVGHQVLQDWSQHTALTSSGLMQSTSGLIVTGGISTVSGLTSSSLVSGGFKLVRTTMRPINC